MTSAPEARHDLTRYAWLSIAAAVATISLKTAAWWFTGSVGLLSDAIESVINLVAAVVALVALKIAAKPPDHNHHYGHAKAEYFSAMIEATMIFVAAVVIIITAVDRFLHPRPVEDIGVGVAVSAVASVINGATAWVLIRAGARHKSITLTADGKHLLTDVWTSIGVIVGVIAVVVTGWERLDPVVAAAVGLNILATGWSLLAGSVDGLMDHTAPSEVSQTITAVLDRHASEDVFFHEVRTRESGHITFLSAHITLPAEWTIRQGHRKIRELEDELRAEIGDLDVQLRMESKDLGCTASLTGNDARPPTSAD